MKAKFLTLPMILALSVPSVVMAQDSETRDISLSDAGMNLQEEVQENNSEKRVMEPRDIVELPLLSNISLSPNGQYVYFLERKTLWEKNKNINLMRIYDIEAGKYLDVPEAEKDTESFRAALWSPDSKYLLTELDRKADKDTQAYIWKVGKSKISPVTKQPYDVDDLKWGADADHFYFTTRPLTDEKAIKNHEKIQPYEEEENDELWAFDRSKNLSTKLIAGDFHISGYSMSRDGKHILYSRAPQNYIAETWKSELWLYDVNTTQFRELTRNDYRESSAKLSPDNIKFAFIATVNEQGEEYYEDGLFVQNVGEVQPKALLTDIDMEVSDFQWDQSGNGLYLIGNTGLTDQLYHYDLTSGQLEQLTQGEHDIGSWEYSPQSDSHILQLRSADNPGDLWIKRGKQPVVQVTNIMQKWASQFKLPSQQAFQYTARDGQKLEGLLVLPEGVADAKNLPLITITHGGPRSSSQFGSWNVSRSVAVFAGRGYAVFLPNHRGGTGYGDEFMRDMLKGYFANSHLDVLDGVDALIANGIADPDRLAVMGWSAGGHMTSKLITFTNRFKAASSGAGASEWISMYAESDVRHSRTPIFGGKAPWEQGADLKAYMDHSPLFDAWKVRTPTLFWVGSSDRRVPPTQSIMMHNGVRMAGVPTHLYIAPGEPHNYGEPRHKLFKIETELKWYSDYVLSHPTETVQE